MSFKALHSRWLEIGITILGFIGLGVFLLFYGRVFPSAAIDLNLSRDEIHQRAESYLQAEGYDVQGYKSAVGFDQDQWGSYYLQHTLGVQESNRLIRVDGLPIWYWHARWFRPSQKEEFSVFLQPDGEIIGFSRSIPEEMPGAAISQDLAHALALDYLTQDRGWPVVEWEQVVASSEERPNGRTDHHFEWRRRDFDVGSSELRLMVDVQGDRVHRYDFWLKVPEAFQRDFLEQRNRASFVNSLSFTIGFFGFAVAALGAYLIAVWRGVTSWRTGLLPALAVGLVSVLAGLNELNLYQISYPTTEDYALFWLERLINLAIWAGYNVALVLILWAGGQQLSKRVWRRQNKILARSEERWITLARSGWRGLMVGGMMAGYLVLFYLVATRLFGGWTPLDSPDTGLFATPLPFLAPLKIGLLPAMDEELVYRLVGISLILALTRRRWLALLVPGMLWGFAHLSYVRDPFYLRGIELAIAGVFLLGLVFLRFDLITTIVAHFAYNAGLTALPLLRSGESYFVFSGLIVIAAMLIPVVPGALVGLRLRLRGKDQETISPHIRPATPSDVMGLTSLPVAARDWAALLDDPAAGLYCLVTNEEMVGVAAGRHNCEGIGEITVVFVAPPWRRKYWGSALVDALCTHLKEQGTHSVQTSVEAGDKVAEAFWASQGWQPHIKMYSHSLLPPVHHHWRDLLRTWHTPNDGAQT